MPTASNITPIDPSQLSLKDEYGYYRGLIGSLAEVSLLMGIAISTIWRRENGKFPVTLEHVFAIRYTAWLIGHNVDHKVND